MINTLSYIGIRKQGDPIYVCFRNEPPIVDEEYDWISYADFCSGIGIAVTDDWDDRALYRDDHDIVRLDKSWEHKLMPYEYVRERHRKRLTGLVDEELVKDAPDQLKILALIRDILKLPSVHPTKKETYQIAWDSLKYADFPKPAIEQKLRDKIAELEASGE